MELKKVSEKLRNCLTTRRIKEITLGNVTSADPTPSTSGPGISVVLREELERAGVPVKLRANVGLSVAYRGRRIPLENDRKLERLVVELSVTASFAAENSQEGHSSTNRTASPTKRPCATSSG